MTLKNAVLLALIGTILMTALLVWTFALNLLNTVRGLVPAATVLIADLCVWLLQRDRVPLRVP